jgi:hypothetical protein
MISIVIVTLLLLVEDDSKFDAPRGEFAANRRRRATLSRDFRGDCGERMARRAVYSPFAPMRLIFRVFVLPRRPNG